MNYWMKWLDRALVAFGFVAGFLILGLNYKAGAAWYLGMAIGFAARPLMPWNRR